MEEGGGKFPPLFDISVKDNQKEKMRGKRRENERKEKIKEKRNRNKEIRKWKDERRGNNRKRIRWIKK